jgi:erythromycin esterase
MPFTSLFRLILRSEATGRLPPFARPKPAHETTCPRFVSVYVLAAAIVCLAGVLPDLAVGQPSDAFREWAVARAIPLRTVEADGDATDLAPLKSIVGSARVVALGEPTHGAHEPLAFRNRLIRFLVEQMGFIAVALETGFAESYSIERLAAGGPGEIHSVVRDEMTWGLGEYAENEELIRWIRDYNRDPTHRRKVRFYGIDLSGGNGETASFDNSRLAVDFAIELLARADSVEARRIRRGLDPLLKRFSNAGYSELSSTERDRLASGLEEIAATMEQRRSALVRISSDEEYRWAVHSVAVARQLKLLFEVSPPIPAPGQALPPDVYRAMNARDSAMADNVRWALEREGPDGRLVLFAHNVHVMNSVLEGGPWSAFRQPSLAMGKSLRATLGRELVIIGATAGATAGKLPPMEADPASVHAALGGAAIPRFILDLRPARDEPPVFAWLSERRTLHANLTTHNIITPVTAFDALFFVETLTPAHVRQP